MTLMFVTSASTMVLMLSMDDISSDNGVGEWKRYPLAVSFDIEHLSDFR